MCGYKKPRQNHARHEQLLGRRAANLFAKPTSQPTTGTPSAKPTATSNVKRESSNVKPNGPVTVTSAMGGGTITEMGTVPGCG